MSKKKEEEKLKMFQLSTKTCFPCKQAIDYIKKQFNPIKEEYEVVYLDDPNITEMQSGLAAALKVRSVPHFAIVNVEKKEIVDDFTGFDRPLIHHYLTEVIRNEQEKGKSNSEEEE